MMCSSGDGVRNDSGTMSMLASVFMAGKIEGLLFLLYLLGPKFYVLRQKLVARSSRAQHYH